MTWEESLTLASQLLEARENYQRSLGRLSAEIADEFGPAKLEEFSDTMKELNGMTISVSTLRNYRWVYLTTKDLDLPEDMSYRTLQYIASSGQPEYWAKRIKDEGLSSPQVLKLIRAEKGLDKKDKTVVCPSCGATVSV